MQYHFLLALTRIFDSYYNGHGNRCLVHNVNHERPRLTYQQSAHTKETTGGLSASSPIKNTFKCTHVKYVVHTSSTYNGTQKCRTRTVQRRTFTRTNHLIYKAIIMTLH